MNESTAALATALAKVQAELPKLERDRTVEVEKKSGGTYSYSYVTLANLNDAILPLLAKHGLAFAAMPGAGNDGKMVVRYHLLHESGEALSGEFPISGEGGIQMIGGRITYARRYCLAAVVGVAADEDDESRLDAEPGRGAAQRAAAPRAAAAPAKAAAGRTAQRRQPPPLPGEDGPRPYTPAQRAKLMAGFGELGVADRTERLDICSRIAGRKLGSANDLSIDEARRVIDVLESAAKADNPMLTLAELTAQPDGPEGGTDG
jgi:hypothetical protein